MKQYTSTLFMVEPIDFRYNKQTAVNNHFMTETDVSDKVIQDNALEQFKNMDEKLRSHGIEVITLKDTAEPHSPDSIYPNNWITFHKDGRVALYPMFAKNRRVERRPEEVIQLMEEKGFEITEVIDYTPAEEDQYFLEGTGSMILDRENKVAYAAISDRTDPNLFLEFCEDFEYTPIIFSAYHLVGGQREPIYHTNIMMCIADEYTIVCLSSIDNQTEAKSVIDHLTDSGKTIIDITEDQMNQFAGNMLQVGAKDGKKYLVMSQAAYDSLSDKQIKVIEKFNPILPVDIHTIETLGGGSARCMIAEVFLPRKI